MEKEKLQIENGNFTRIINPLIEQLIKIPFKGCELAVVMFIIRKTYGYNKTQDEISITQFEKALEKGRPTIVKALKNLQLVNIVKLVKLGDSEKSANIYSINKYYEDWQLVKLVKLVKHKWSTSKASLTATSKASLTHKRQYKDNTKEILQTDVCEEWNSDNYINSLLSSKQRHISIIGKYLKERKVIFPSKLAAEKELHRWLKSARELAEYTDEQIDTSYSYVSTKFPAEWNMSTIAKYINNPIIKTL